MLARQKESEATAQSLCCYSCGNLGKFSNLNHCPTSKCSSNSTVCYTGNLTKTIENENVVDLGYSLYKFCSPICGSTSLNFGVASMDTSCCQSFLCNISAAGRGPRASTLVLGLGLLLSLLVALLRFGP
ncbi:hypothetical protein E5288_WYG022294 [Bos mutus]|uniref:UPAR/Ly6 domain-containing protein n=1 Tax=Bos mutus TaxID=72004 RepID=A0A6B0RUV3_9CETA|nr:hypothetical protein [Bos mutus]